MIWSLQSTRRKDGRYYYEALQRSGPKRLRSVALGYLSDDDVTRVKGVLDAAPAQLFAESHACVKSYVLGTGGEVFGEALAEIDASDARRLQDAGKYGEMTLRAFYTNVWSPHRVHDHKATWEREDASRWPYLLRDLGHVRLAQLDKFKWDRFMRSMTTWGPTAKRLAKNEYRLLLKYAHEGGAIPSVHAMDKIDGATKRAREPRPLPENLVVAIIDNATYPIHRALLALAFGQGTRPAEPGSQRWEHVHWKTGKILIDGTKNHLASARVHMAPLTLREMKRWWIACGKPSTGWCFPWRKGFGYDPIRGRPIAVWRTALKKAARRAGGAELEQRVFRRLARHTFATAAAMSGVPKTAAKQMMRHSTTSEILEEAYEIPDNDEVGDVIDALMPKYDGAPSKRRARPAPRSASKPARAK